MLEKDSTLPVYVAFKQSKNKTIAKTLLHADFIQFAPDYADDYFASKIWEAEEGMFCTVEGQFYTDLFAGDIIWNAEKGEPERVMVEPELAGGNEQLNADVTEEKMTAVEPLQAKYRAASLVLFGPVEEITATQYGQVSGRTDIMGKEEAEGVVACTGHIIAEILPLLIIDIATTEFCCRPISVTKKFTMSQRQFLMLV